MFGNFAQTAVTLMAYDFGGNLKIKRSVNGEKYEANKKELAEALGGLDDPEGLMLLREFFESNEKEICKQNQHN
jgi:HEAT repeat protein